jgi:hypothetical protein
MRTNLPKLAAKPKRLVIACGFFRQAGSHGSTSGKDAWPLQKIRTARADSNVGVPPPGRLRYELHAYALLVHTCLWAHLEYEVNV